MSSRTPQPPLLCTLPPDLIDAINRAAAQAPPPNTRAAWAAYERMKGVISRAVGWDSPHGSSELYDLAVQTYVRKAGL